MSWLFDTQVAIYALADPQELSAEERAILARPARDLFVSLVTVWEVAIKNALPARGGRNPFPMDAAATLQALRRSRFQIMPIAGAHVCAVEDLALIHRDPFDRLLVAQAKTENMSFVTRDKILWRYFEQ